MATLTSPAVVYDLLMDNDPEEELPLRVYQYLRRGSAHVRYAAFWTAEGDDMATAPDVRDYVLLWADGAFTPIGKVWVRWWEEKHQTQTSRQEGEGCPGTGS